MRAVMACPACRTGVVARRGDPLCESCVKAAREMAARPSWVFDSPLLRQALAEVNLPAVPAIVRAASGLSQRDLAGLAGWSAAALSYYERGRRDGMFDIRSVLLLADAIGMPRTALLPLVLASPDTGAGASPGVTTAPNAVMTSAAAPPGVTAALVRYWRASADALYNQALEVGGAALLPPAWHLWRQVRLALHSGRINSAGGQFEDAAGEVALCAGRIALDCGRFRLARSLLSEARTLAGQAENLVLRASALADESLLACETPTGDRDSARQALLLAFQAQEEGRYLPVPRLHALIAMRHAAAVSLLGDKTAFANAIATARRELDRDTRQGDLPGWQRRVSKTEITISEAAGYLNLSEADRSAGAFRELLAGSLSGRDRARCGAGLARALLSLGDPGEAVATAKEVMPAIESETAPAWCLNQLRAVRQATACLPDAADFGERFDLAERTLTDPHGLYI